MSSRGAITIVLVLAVWVLLGPIAMAFDSCGAPAAMCDGPCGAFSCGIAAPTLSIAPAPASLLPTGADRHPLANTFAGIEHPPKSPPRST
jgi:hypothetical protein